MKKDSQCWWNKYYALPNGTRCPNVGAWHFPPTTSEGYMLQESVWCDEHKHDTDVPICTLTTGETK